MGPLVIFNTLSTAFTRSEGGGVGGPWADFDWSWMKTNQRSL